MSDESTRESEHAAPVNGGLQASKTQPGEPPPLSGQFPLTSMTLEHATQRLDIPIVSVDTFKSLVIEHLTAGYEGWSDGDTWGLVIETGIGKFDPQDIGTFMRSLRGYVFLPAVAVDIGCEFVWLVSGSDAILVRKPQKKV